MAKKPVPTNKAAWKDAQLYGPKCVFGTSRSTNAPTVNIIAEKPVKKQTIGYYRRQRPKVSQDAPIQEKSVVEEGTKNEAISSVSDNVNADENSSARETKSRSKKNVCFQEPLDQSIPDIGKEEVHTPYALRSTTSSVKKSTLLDTPYQSAENCSNCKLHKLESSSYWLAQIKLAELAEKHFVAATFFRLAHECSAEPVLTLRMELRRYLTRHTWLSTKTDWISVSHSYGLLEGESSVGRLDSTLGDTGHDARRYSAFDFDSDEDK
ncbi:hypothetical protein AQUCO_00400212v1 [Aquilegia coerulea]|uniref:Uncharacterized protein n=1 Tax=Aquilegia coerulea TaxID=218851 RepID=A0A2G5ETW2_AQUCA|nr:hypothetical protein AQUCO_00400212v1 [Aquilegia coerulea]